MVDSLSEEQIAEFKEAFCLFDTDGGGSIGSDELETVMNALGQNPTEAELKAMVDEVDADGSGEIDFPEFLTMLAHRMHGTDEEAEVIEYFRMFDPNGTGFISTADVKQIIDTLEADISGEEREEIVKELDFDGDGVISYEEFANLMLDDH